MKEAALYCRLSASTLNRLRVTGDGPRYTKLAGKVLYDVRDLDQWIGGKQGGSVYFLECGDFIKIGYTAKVLRNRISDLSNATPYDITALATMPGSKRTEF